MNSVYTNMFSQKSVVIQCYCIRELPLPSGPGYSSSMARCVIPCLGTSHIQHPLQICEKTRVVIPVAGFFLSSYRYGHPRGKTLYLEERGPQMMLIFTV